MRSALTSMGFIVGVLLLSGQVSAHEDAAKLPEGPIRDRHELMEGIGDHAKQIGGALKQGTTEGVAQQAEVISAKANKIDALFPKGSTHPKSRAKPEIWENWAEFQRLSAALGKDAALLGQAAREDGDVKAAANKMFENCKSCHDQFRVPEED